MLFKKYMPMLAVAGLMFSNVHAISGDRADQYIFDALSPVCSIICGIGGVYNTSNSNSTSKDCSDTWRNINGTDVTYQDLCDDIGNLASNLYYKENDSLS